MLAAEVGKLLRGCKWVGIPFAGGMCEVREMTDARTIICNDLHRHLINLAQVVADPKLYDQLIANLEKQLFHTDALEKANWYCQQIEEGAGDSDRCYWATQYFICCWMSRSGTAGTKAEFNQKLSVRWEAAGGDSAIRYRSAVAGLEAWHKLFQQRNATFTALDCFDFLDKCKDRDKHGIYADPPFPSAGARYRHAPTTAAEVEWHTRLRDRLEQFDKTKVVVRYHAHKLITRLYDEWECVELTGRAQSNALRDEYLFIRNI